MINIKTKEDVILNLNFNLLLILPLAIIISPVFSEIIIFLICVLFLTKNYLYNDWSFLKDKIIKYLFIIYIFLLINLFFSDNFYLSFLRNIFFFKYILFIAAIKHCINNKKKFNIITLAWSVIIIVAVANIYYQWVFGKDFFGFQDRDPLRFNGFFRKENASTFIGSFLFISLFFLFKKNKKNFIILAIISLIIFNCFISGGRAPFLRILFTITLILFLINLEFKKKLIIFSSIILIFTSTLILNEKTRIRYIYQLFDSQDTFSFKQFKHNFTETSNHYGHFVTAYNIFIDNKWFGVGNKNFRVLCSNQKYTGDGYQVFSYYRACSTHPHQIYLELLSEHGFIGSLAILSMLFLIFYNFYKYCKNKKKNLILFPLCFLISNFLPLIPTGSFFSNSFQTLFWTVFGFTYLLYNNKILNK